MLYVDNPSWFESNWYFVLIGIVLGLIALWLLVVLVTFGFATYFKKNIKKTSVAINLLLTQRRDSMLALEKILAAHKVEAPKADMDSINRLERVENFQALSKEERDDRVLTFVHGAHNLLNLANKYPEVKSDEEFVTLVAIFNDVEDSYRRKVSAYNYYVTGYNYWVKIPTVKWLLKLFKNREQDLIV